MKKASRQIEIALTPEQEPVWEQALSKFNLTSKTLRDYYDPPITPAANGRASMPYDPDMAFEMIAILKQIDDVAPKIRNDICQQLARALASEKML
jgi:hypothetical protein